MPIGTWSSATSLSPSTTAVHRPPAMLRFSAVYGPCTWAPSSSWIQNEAPLGSSKRSRPRLRLMAPGDSMRRRHRREPFWRVSQVPLLYGVTSTGRLVANLNGTATPACSRSVSSARRASTSTVGITIRCTLSTVLTPRQRAWREAGGTRRKNGGAAGKHCCCQETDGDTEASTHVRDPSISRGATARL